MTARLRGWVLVGLGLVGLGACSASPAAPDSGIIDDDSGIGGDAGPAADAEPGALDASGAPDCWQLATIPDISAWGSAGAGYDAPALSAACEGSEFVIRSNGIPTFDFVPITPNDLAAQDYTFRMPRSPARAASTTIVPLLGTAAVTVTGLPIFGPTENPMDDYRDPYLDDALRNLLDECNGHTAPRGVYHFHARPGCIVTSLGGERSGLVIGYALDGYPILAPVVCEDAACTTTSRVQSSWRLTLAEYTAATRGPAWDVHEYVEGLGDLDECNGLEITDPASPYDYAYFATDTFPYFMGCYRGTPTPMR